VREVVLRVVVLPEDSGVVRAAILEGARVVDDVQAQVLGRRLAVPAPEQVVVCRSWWLVRKSMNATLAASL
jgi:hypothetical protein